MTLLDAPVAAAAYDASALRRLNVVNDHVRAENAGAVDRVMATFGPAPRFHLNGETFDGTMAVGAAHAGLFEGFADWSVEPVSVHVDRTAIVVEAVQGGTHTGTFQGVPATGRTVRLATCTVFEFDDTDTLTDERLYLDVATLLGHLGV